MGSYDDGMIMRWRKPLIYINGALLLMSVFVAMVIADSLTPLGLFSLASTQLLLMLLMCLGWGADDLARFISDIKLQELTGEKSRLVSSHIISLAVAIFAVLLLSGCALYGLVALRMPDHKTTVNGHTYYLRAASMSGDCFELEEVNAFMVSSSDYRQDCSAVVDGWDRQATATPIPQARRHISAPQSTASSAPSSAPGELSGIEPTTPAPFPEALTDDDLMKTVPLEHPGNGITDFGVFAYENQFYGALRINGSWVPGSTPIAPLGMDGEIYSLFAADQNLLALGPASANGGQAFYSYDGGATWQEFKPQGLDSTQNSQTFLDDVKKTSEGYEIDMNYPLWITNPGDPDRFVSPDGVNWEKK